MALTEIAKRVGDPHTPTPVLLTIYQATAKIAKLEPQQNAVTASGPGFSISIHLDSKPAEKVVTSTIEHDDLGEPPEYLSNLNNELEFKE